MNLNLIKYLFFIQDHQGIFIQSIVLEILSYESLINSFKQGNWFFLFKIKLIFGINMQVKFIFKFKNIALSLKI
jgi:hypothetical protein